MSNLGRLWRLAPPVIALAAVLAIGAYPLGSLPPLGSFLDPWGGIWSTATTALHPARAGATIPGLSDSVVVRYDDRYVPHVFASREDDAVRALGYVVAHDRLFQLEVQTRATAGTLTELVGPAALELDREMRRLGLARSAEREFAGLPPDGLDRRILDAFAAGVNAWIDGVGRRRLPFEYHLLGRRPTRWQPEHGLYLIRRMGYTLTYFGPEFERMRAARLVGAAAADALLPVRAPIQEPVVPGGGPYPTFDRTPLPPPAGERAAGVGHDDRTEGPTFDTRRRHASNNWAVAPRRSASGHGLLAGDPHLELTLPSVWYEVHLNVPDRLDVYGVTLPGSPTVIIGFNRDVAWSFTNSQADVLDFYAEELDDLDRPTRYRLDGAWRPLEQRVEEFRAPDGARIAVDTIQVTHRGPVVWRDGRPYSIRWTVLEAKGTGGAVHRATKATSVAEWLEAMEAYEAPIQNGLVADRAGRIAVRAAGWYPVRPGGRGDTIFDGTTSASDWTGRLPLERQPFAVDPAQGFLASANQQPLTGSDYLGGDPVSPWRALRINQLLRSDSAVTPDAMRRYQLDEGNARADLFVPAFLGAVARGRAGGGVAPAVDQAAEILDAWDRRYTKDNSAAVVFELAIRELARRAWDELSVNGAARARPSDMTLWRLLQDPTSPWWDRIETPDVVEQRDNMVLASLAAAMDTARARYGDAGDERWRWDRAWSMNIHHALRIPALSALRIPHAGGPGTLNPLYGPRGTEGASWRMVVELGPEVTARGVYPGGQSGNPVSPRYDDRLPAWKSGELADLRFPRRPSDLPDDRVTAVLVLRPEPE